MFKNDIARYKYLHLFSIIGAICIFYGVYIYRTFCGYYFYDDYSYAKYAYQVLQSKFEIAPDTFSHRLAFIYLIAGMFTVLGIHDFSTILVPVISFAGTLLATFLYLRHRPVW